MQLIKRITGAVVVSAALTAAGLVAGSPALAGPNCPSGYHCVMRDNLYDDQVHDYFNSDTNFSDDYFSNGGGVVNDNVSAASNSSGANLESHYYRDANFGVFLFCINPGGSTNGLNTAQNDNASSLRLRGRTSIACFS